MIVILLSIAFYLAATLWLAAEARHGQITRHYGWLWLATPALALHALHHWLSWTARGTSDLHFFSALSLVALGMALLTTLTGLLGRMRALGVVVFPQAALLLLLFALIPNTSPSTPLDWRLLLHAWLALLAYATLALAAWQAILLWLQERALRRRSFHTWLRALPPLTELESLLFRTIRFGFVLLTAALLTGALFIEDMFAQHLVHKTVLSILSWLAFAALLLGRRLYGWRGITAVRWTLGAMLLLVLAFFGSKFVLELVLHRTPGI
jgi:ABC-type uncharacterized transport system permease subunit